MNCSPQHAKRARQVNSGKFTVNLSGYQRRARSEPCGLSLIGIDNGDNSLLESKPGYAQILVPDG